MELLRAAVQEVLHDFIQEFLLEYYLDISSEVSSGILPDFQEHIFPWGDLKYIREDGILTAFQEFPHIPGELKEEIPVVTPRRIIGILGKTHGRSRKIPVEIPCVTPGEIFCATLKRIPAIASCKNF